MIANNSLIYAPVSIYDIQTMFNVVLTKDGETKVSNDLGTIIGKKTNSTVSGWTVTSRRDINKWAKYKPVKIASIGAISDTQRLNVEWGITNIPKWTRLDRLETFWLEENTSDSVNYPACGGFPFEDYWKYSVPNGTASEPFRLTDFVQYPVTTNNYGYFKDAEPEVGAIDANKDGTYSKVITINPNGSMRIIWHTRSNQSPMSISYGDFNVPSTNTSLSGFYFGATMRRVNGGTKYAITEYAANSQAIETNITLADIDAVGAQIDVQFASVTAINTFMTGNSLLSADTQDFYITPIFSNQALYDSTYHYFTQTNHSSITGTFLTITEREQITVNLQYAQITLGTIYIYKNLDGRNISYSITVQNEEINPGVTRYYDIRIQIFDRYDSQVYDNSWGLHGSLACGSSTVLTGNIDARQWMGTDMSFRVDTRLQPAYNILLKKEDYETGDVLETEPITPN